MKKFLPPQNDKEQWLYDVISKAWGVFCKPDVLKMKSGVEMLDYVSENIIPPISPGTPGFEKFQQYITDVSRERYLEISRQACEASGIEHKSR